MKVRRRSSVLEAHRWMANGDHPDDGSIMMRLDDGEPFLSEGKVVRRYRHPSIPGEKECSDCHLAMHYHGWIDLGYRGLTVCPGSWILRNEYGEHVPVSPAMMTANYEEVMGV